ncbi:hypothetical protein P152DRAFT_44048 [Eremomyces bilateralis CBS 781.70]|uniref:Uncharacterized protein n=1 Tax=Eremomyces bilateralis CBS 781.70 TaxID=1392243 RepID=A0A6G1G259_9PEZI|nr:uncharacterized protein P152DRAFT_44048 [Eremomyces bilateralis CBS 781.70]KAF1812072.1 hypothetical protein P152DRAFT_44048 [Eremomyces bilateralis CBS 781.70]
MVQARSLVRCLPCRCSSVSGGSPRERVFRNISLSKPLGDERLDLARTHCARRNPLLCQRLVPSRTKNRLVHEIHRVTKINVDVLYGRELSASCIAQRMSWAAHRTTTKVEDMAYLLMGLFGVNMPLLYGEGAKAFLQLQEEIMKTSRLSSTPCFLRNPPAAQFHHLGKTSLRLYISTKVHYI